MTKLEGFLNQVRSLSPEELAHLIAKLKSLTTDAPAVDEIEVGLRGLAAWTESTRDDDWAEFYPPTLRNGQGQSA